MCGRGSCIEGFVGDGTITIRHKLARTGVRQQTPVVAVVTAGSWVGVASAGLSNGSSAKHDGRIGSRGKAGGRRETRSERRGALGGQYCPAFGPVTTEVKGKVEGFRAASPWAFK